MCIHIRLTAQRCRLAPGDIRVRGLPLMPPGNISLLHRASGCRCALAHLSKPYQYRRVCAVLSVSAQQHERRTRAPAFDNERDIGASYMLSCRMQDVTAKTDRCEDSEWLMRRHVKQLVCDTLSCRSLDVPGKTDRCEECDYGLSFQTISGS